MINWYDGVMDTNLVMPRGVDQTEVIFDFYFPDVVSEDARRGIARVLRWASEFRMKMLRSVSQCSAGWVRGRIMPGRLSVRREAGEHLFHRLLHRDVMSGLKPYGCNVMIRNLDENSRPPAARTRSWLWSRRNYRQYDWRRDL